MDEAHIAHRGNTYGIGRGPDHYGIWDLRAGGDPIHRFENTPEGWAQAWERFNELDSRYGSSGWRSAGIGWILLHFVVGLALWFITVAVGMGLLAALGRDIDRDPQGATIGGLVLAIPVAIAGWYLFVYLKQRVAVRVWILVGAILLGGLLVLALGYGAQGPA